MFPQKTRKSVNPITVNCINLNPALDSKIMILLLPLLKDGIIGAYLFSTSWFAGNV